MSSSKVLIQPVSSAGGNLQEQTTKEDKLKAQLEPKGKLILPKCPPLKPAMPVSGLSSVWGTSLWRREKPTVTEMREVFENWGKRHLEDRYQTEWAKLMSAHQSAESETRDRLISEVRQAATNQSIGQMTSTVVIGFGIIAAIILFLELRHRH